jgi:Protein of unknown function (DUF2958)
MARQQMILAEQRKKLLANGAKNLAHRMKDGNTEDFEPVLKLFNPMGAATWLFSEMDEDEILFGLCDLGMGSPELGYVSLAEIRSLRLPLGLYIERDEHFKAHAKLSVYAEAARRLNRITESTVDLYIETQAEKEFNG